MRGINPQKIPELIAKDVEVVEKEARFIFEISPDETRIEIRENPSSRLNVMAIIGPSQGLGRNWEKVLLAEIGISRSRPYHEARGLDVKSDLPSIPRRRKWFSMSLSQYRLVAPIVFKKIEGLAYQRISLWEKGPLSSNVFMVRAQWHRWIRSQKALITKNGYIEAIKGVRFTVSLKDEYFVRDICWAESNLNKHLKNYLKGLVNFIDLRLNWYKFSYKGRMPIQRLKGIREVRERLRQPFLLRNRHLLIEVVRRLKQEKRNHFWYQVAEMIVWDGKESEESRLASLASSCLDLPRPRSRLGSIQLRITTGIDKKKDYIVFEVFLDKNKALSS